MSGSRTANFSEDLTGKSMTGNSLPSMETPNKEDMNNHHKNETVRVPVSFKLKLIAEVKKHDIIWQDLKEKKNNDLIGDAWQRVRKALVIKKAGFCEKQWKKLITGYRSHINRGTPMNIDLVRDMAFMRHQLKKSSSDVEQSDSEAIEGEPPAKRKSCTQKPKKVKSNSNSESDAVSEAQRASVAMLNLLFKNVPPEVMLPVRNSLVEVLIKVMPEVDGKISEHAKQQMARSGNFSNLDWSALDIAPEICKAVWDYKVMQKLLND